jgi:hypothetical protein
MSAPVVHFEIPAEDIEKLSSFYTKLLGWKFAKASMPPEAPPYWLITTKPKQKDPGINGGMFKRMDSTQRTINYVMVTGIDQYAKKLEELGGKVVMPKQQVPQVGYFVVAMDPEGNAFGLWEEVKS